MYLIFIGSKCERAIIQATVSDSLSVGGIGGKW
jgi:hypothetical protein